MPESDGVGTPVEISLQWGKRGKSSSYVTPDRLRKKAQDVVIKLFDLFHARFWVGKLFRIWTPKGGPPQYPTKPRLQCCHFFFLWSAPVAFRRVALETPEWTSRDSNHHRQFVSAGKTNAIPTEPSGRLAPVLSLRIERWQRRSFQWGHPNDEERSNQPLFFPSNAYRLSPGRSPR